MGLRAVVNVVNGVHPKPPRAAVLALWYLGGIWHASGLYLVRIWPVSALYLALVLRHSAASATSVAPSAGTRTGGRPVTLASLSGKGRYGAKRALPSVVASITVSSAALPIRPRRLSVFEPSCRMTATALGSKPRASSALQPARNGVLL